MRAYLSGIETFVERLWVYPEPIGCEPTYQGLKLDLALAFKPVKDGLRAYLSGIETHPKCDGEDPPEEESCEPTYQGLKQARFRRGRPQALSQLRAYLSGIETAYA